MKPLSQQSVRFTTKNGRMISYQPRRIVEAKKYIQYLIKEQNIGCYDSDIILYVVFSFKSKKKGFKNTRPDIDNLLKFIIDAMKGLVYKDDSQIVALSTMKINNKEDYIDIKILAKNN